MTTQEEVDIKSRELARLERSLALTKIKQRKADTRRKIELGGLVIKAKMDEYSKALILGVLLDAAQQLKDDPASGELFQQKGEGAFMGY
jgi:hypothetical protein